MFVVDIIIIGKIDQLSCECSPVSKEVTIVAARDSRFIRSFHGYGYFRVQ